jgi:hypothetical protein
MTTITPQDNKIRNCAFRTDETGNPLAKGAFCCADGRCFQEGLNARCN